MKKRILSMFLALAMCLTMVPATAFAAEADVQPDTVQADTQESENDENMPADVADIQPNTVQTDTQESENDETSTGAEKEGANKMTEAVAPEVYDDTEQTEQTEETNEYVAWDNTTQQGFETLTAALKSGTDITLLKNTAESVTVDSGKTLTIPEGVTLTGVIVLREGTLNMEGGNIINEAGNGVILNDVKAVLNLNSGKITGRDYAVSVMQAVVGKVTVNVSGGELIAQKAKTAFYGWQSAYIKGEDVYHIVSTNNDGYLSWNFTKDTTEVVAVDENKCGYKTLSEALKSGKDVTLLQNMTESVSIDSGKTLTIPEGVTLTGVIVLYDGTLNMEGGNIINEDGTGVILNNVKAVLNLNSGKITGKNYAVNVMNTVSEKATVNVTGGELIAQNDKTIFGGWNPKYLTGEGVYRIVSTDSEGHLHWEFTKNTTEVVAVDENKYSYKTLSEALKSGKDVTLLQDTSESVSVDSGKTLTIPEGVTLTGVIVLYDGTLNMEGGNIINQDGTGVILNNVKAVLNLNSGKITGKNYAVNIMNTVSEEATVNVTGGELIAQNNKTIFSGWKSEYLKGEGVYRIVRTDNDTYLHWEFTKDTSKAVAIAGKDGYDKLSDALASDSAEVTLQKSTEEKVSVASGKKLTIPEGVTLTGVIVLYDGTLNMEGGNIVNKDGAGVILNDVKAVLNLNSGTITGQNYAVNIMNTVSEKATVNVTGGELIAQNNKTIFSGWKSEYLKGEGVYRIVRTDNDTYLHWEFTKDTSKAVAIAGKDGYDKLSDALASDSAEVTLQKSTEEKVSVASGKKLTIPEGVTLTGVIVLYDGTLNMEGGNIVNKDGAGVILNDVKAVLNLNSGTITGQNYAVNVMNTVSEKATVNVTGGELIAQNAKTIFSGWKPEYLKDEDVYRIVSTDSDGYLHWEFTKDTSKAVAIAGKNGYDKLSDALASDSAEVLLQKSTEENVAVGAGKTLTIPEGVTLTGNVNVFGEGAVLNLNGTIDGQIMINAGTMNMNAGSAVNYTNETESTGSAVSINNNGSFNMNGGKITANGNNARGITLSSANAKMMISDGEVNAGSYAVVIMSAAQNAEIKVNGGLYTSDTQQKVFSNWKDSYVTESGKAMQQTSKRWLVVGPSTLTLKGVESFTITVDGESESTTGTTREIPYGKSVTVSAGENAQGYWKNASNLIVSEEPSYEFIMFEDTTLTWVPATDNVVTFRSDFNAIVATYTAEEFNKLSALPDVPVKVGYTGTWMLDENTKADLVNIKKALESGSVTVKASYTSNNSTAEEDAEKYTVTVGNNIDEEQSVKKYIGGTYVAVKTGETKTAETDEGTVTYQFSHWATDRDGTKVVSYATEYTFRVLNNVTLYAIYVADEEELIVPEDPVLNIDGRCSKVTVNEVEKYRYTVSVTRFVPEGMEIVETGIQYSRDNNTWLKSAASGKDNTGSYTLNVTTSTNTTTVYFRGYVTVKVEGHVSTYYSDSFVVNAQ